MTAVKYDTPWPELPEELRRQIDTKYKEIGDRWQRDINTPHPDNPAVPLRMPDHRALMYEVRAMKKMMIDMWNQKRGGNELS